MSEIDARSWKMDLTFSGGCELDDGCRRLSDLLDKLDEHLGDLPGLDAAVIADLRLVCDELGSNIIRHSSPDKPVRLEIDVRYSGDGVVRLRVRDDGKAFNPLNQPEPYVGGDLEKRKVGGLGLYLIRQIFPAATYCRQNDRNIVEVECRTAHPV